MTGDLPVAREWFRAKAIDDRITRIDEPFVDELLRANAWHVRGSDRDLLVDTGLGVGHLRTSLPDLFVREPIVVLTHAHLDHMGSAHEFAGCRAHPSEAIEQPQPGSLRGPDLALELGLDEELPPLLITALPEAGYEPRDYRLRPAKVERWVEEGDRVDLGDRVFTVLHLPGHSPGGIALLDERGGTLFSGDVIYDDELLDAIVGADRGSYERSIRRLRDLDVDIVHAGHGESFDRARLREIIDAYLRSEVST